MAKYMLAAEVEAIAEELIADVEQHEPLQRARIIYLFRSDVPVSHGRWILGRARKLSGLGAWLSQAHIEDVFESPRPFFVIEISHPTWLGLDEDQRRALVDHELCHCVVDKPDADEPKLGMRGHDFEEFTAIIRRHGLWSRGDRELGAAVVEQLSMAVQDVVDFIEGIAGPTNPGDGPEAGPEATEGDQ